MTLPRAFTKAICRGLIVGLLFAQFAVASYACPRLMPMNTGADTEAASSSLAVQASLPAGDPIAMAPDCDQIDEAAANLCAEHCRHGQQTVDAGIAPALLTAVPILLYPRPFEPANTTGISPVYSAKDTDLAAGPPPHAILHCVFRI